MLNPQIAIFFHVHISQRNKRHKRDNEVCICGNNVKHLKRRIKAHEHAIALAEAREVIDVLVKINEWSADKHAHVISHLVRLNASTLHSRRHQCYYSLRPCIGKPTAPVRNGSVVARYNDVDIIDITMRAAILLPILLGPLYIYHLCRAIPSHRNEKPMQS